MTSTKRRLRPGSLGIVWMMAVNAVLSLVMLTVMFKLFGVSHLLPDFAVHHAWAADAEHWQMFGTLVPGAAIGFGLLWFWLVLTGRSGKGIAWGGAAIYGLIIGICDIPLSGFLTGLLHGSPLFGLLIGLVIMLLVPSIGLCMAAFGITMGLVNGRFAHNWIERRYVGNSE
jgi:hypothetical protein